MERLDCLRVRGSGGGHEVIGSGDQEPRMGTAPPVPRQAGGSAASGGRRLGCLLLGGRYPFCRLLPGGAAEPGRGRSAREGQVDPGRIRGELYRHLPCAGGARSPGRDAAPRLCPRDPGGAQSPRQHPLPGAQRRDGAGRRAVAAAGGDRHVHPRACPAVRARACLGLAAPLAGGAGPVPARVARPDGGGDRAGLVAAGGDRSRDHARAVHVLVADAGAGHPPPPGPGALVVVAEAGRP